ncbi:hypothetical protein, partial [Mesorhizobium sp.]|uniref:hypothetical protein n=1 Tax=Mesorhizobium sp. TaxID=1871066 RepID=UPI0032AFC41D
MKEEVDLLMQLGEMLRAVARLGRYFREGRAGYCRSQCMGSRQWVHGIDFVADDQRRNVERGSVAFR